MKGRQAWVSTARVIAMSWPRGFFCQENSHGSPDDTSGTTRAPASRKANRPRPTRRAPASRKTHRSGLSLEHQDLALGDCRGRAAWVMHLVGLDLKGIPPWRRDAS